MQPTSSQSDGTAVPVTRLPRPKECRWCGARSIINRYWTLSVFPCTDCINRNNAKVFSNKALPMAHLARKTSADVGRNIAAFFVPWHNTRALHQRQYLHFITSRRFDTLLFGPGFQIDYRYVPEPEDPMDIILDMLFPPVIDVTYEEMEDMPATISHLLSPGFGLGRSL